MNRILSLLCFTVLSGAVSAQQWSWLKDQGGYVSWYPYAPQITTLSNGDVVSLNQFESTVGGSAVKSCRLQRIDPTGKEVWKDSTSGHHEAIQILGDHTGGFYATSRYDSWLSNGTVFPQDLGTILSAIDANGNRKWFRILSGIARRMSVDYNGDIVVIENAKAYGSWVLERFDSQGNLLSKTSIPFSVKSSSSNSVWLTDIACDQSGGVYVCGSVNADSIQINGGNYFKPSGHTAGFFLTFTAGGGFGSVEFLGNILPWQLKSDYHNNYYLLFLCGSDTAKIRNGSIKKQYANNYSGIGYFVAKLNNIGGCSWVKEIQRYGVFDNDLYYVMDVRPNGEFYVAGKTFGVLNVGGSQAPLPKGLFVVKADSSGNLLWSQSAVCSDSLYYDFHEISVASNNAVYLTGTYKSSLTAGTHQIAGPDQQYLGMITDGALTTSVSENGLNSKSFFTIAPNPSSGFFTIVSTESISSINVYDLQMKMVGEKVALQGNRIDVCFLDPGVYIVEVRSTNAVERKKVVIQ